MKPNADPQNSTLAGWPPPPGPKFALGLGERLEWMSKPHVTSAAERDFTEALAGMPSGANARRKDSTQSLTKP